MIDRPKYYFLNGCKFWFDSQIRYNNYTCSHSFKPENFCPMKKHMFFINEHKRQKTHKKITADIECCNVNVTTNSNNCVIAKHIPINIGNLI